MVAVTGATGLLGRHILEKLLDDQVETIGLHRPGMEPNFPASIHKRPADILDQVSLREAFAGASTVIHAAAFVSFNPRRRRKIFDVNVMGTRNVIDTCLHLGVKNLIQISSVSALGRKPGEMIREETKWNGFLSTDYAKSKYLSELEVFRAAEEGLTISILNPSVILSASQPERSSATLFNYIWKERPFYTKGTLNYVDARDVADAVSELYRKPRGGEKFILNGGSIPLLEFFQRVAKKFGKRAPSLRLPVALTYCAGLAEEIRSFMFHQEPLVTRQSARMSVQSFQYDNKKAQETLGIQFRSLEDTLEWCCGHFLRNVKTNK